MNGTISVRRGGGQAWFLIVGFLGFSIALASIADMFSARPFDGIVPVPYSREGIGVRSTAPGSPAEKARIRAGECVQGIGRRMVNTTSDASAELQRHAIGDKILYLVKAGPCASGAPGEIRKVTVQLSSERLGGTTYLYYAALGFLFFLIGFFVFWRVPDDRSARIFFLLCVLFLLFFVCRLRPASYWWIDVFVQNTGTVSLFLLPAVFLHFFLIFPRPKTFSFAVPDEWTGEPPPRWKMGLQEFLSASPGLMYLVYAVPPVVFLYDVARQVRGERVASAFRRAALVLDPARRLPRARSGRPGTLGLHARGRARAPAGLPRVHRHDRSERPPSCCSASCCPRPSASTTSCSTASCR